jgi:hypothetical protein
MPRDIIVRPQRGQHVVINPEGSAKLTSARIAKDKLQARVIVEGTYVEPPPPVDPPPVDPPPPPPPPPPDPTISFLKGFGAEAKGGTVPALCRTGSDFRAAAVQPDRLITFPAGAVIDYGTGGLTMAEYLTIDGGKTSTLVGGSLQYNNHLRMFDNRRHYRHIASGAADIGWAKFDKHDIAVYRNDIVAFDDFGEPDGWLDFTRNCYNVTIAFNRLIGLPTYGHNMAILLSNGTKSVSVHHNHFLDFHERLPAGLPGDSGGPVPGANEVTFDSLGNVIDGCKSYALTCQDGGHANDRWNTYNDPSRGTAMSWAFDIETADSLLYSLGSEVNGKPYSEANRSTPFPAPDTSYGLSTIAEHRALTLANAGVRPFDAVAAAAMAKWNRA